MKKRDLIERINREHLTRTAILERATDLAEDEFRLSFSSEEPYDRMFGEEVLGHGKKEVDLSFIGSGRAPLLLDHDPTKVVGVISRAWIEEGRGKAVVRFGKSAVAREVMQDVIDGIRTNVSVGYMVHDMVETGKRKDGVRQYRVTRWKPLENSLVSIPADESVGVSRADITQEAVEKMEHELDTKAVQAAADAERSRVQGILELGKQHNFRDLADDHIAKGTTVDGFRAAVLSEIGKRQAPAVTLRTTDPETADIGMSKKDVQTFDICRAILSQVPGSGVKADFEMECSRAVAKKIGKEPQGIFLPNEVLKRDFAVSGTVQYAVSTDLQSSSFIELLRNKTVVNALGARFLTGLTGDIAIPKQTGATTSYWIDSEGGAITSESQPTLAQLTATPHTLGVYTDITRKALKQSSVDAQRLVTDDISKVIAIAIDAAAIAGTGLNGQPLGLTGSTGINDITVTTGTPTYAQMLDFIAAIMTDNAFMGTPKWAMTAEVWAKLASLPITPTYGEGRILDPNSSKFLGYDFLISENLPANSCFFGDWSQLIVCMWGALDLTVDPYTGGTAGTVRVIGLQDVDIIVRHPQAFSYDLAVTS